MCRITGFLYKNISEEILVSMRDTLAYGGPDDAGCYIDNDIALGHRRLSILDLSKAGHQPMIWQRYIIVYNGEVYNYKNIQKDLVALGYTFDTGTDTEVILKAFCHWGKDCVHHFRGMFAFAIWDKVDKKLTLCRDRVGVKPLYWYQKDGMFMFASELKAFHQHPEFDKTIDKSAVGLFLQQGYIHSPHCIFKYAHKLEPGHFLEVNLKNEVKKTCYWNAQDKFFESEVINKKEDEIVEELEGLLADSFKLRMVSDVPVGIFLSGGIDSSLVTSIIHKETNASLNTFTIGFEDKEKDEAVYAREIAQHIGTNHTEIICTLNDFKKYLPKLPVLYDEPFGDSSAIPTSLVSELAREQVTVSLSADGGDELFGGYTKYEISKKYYPKLDKIPKPLRWIKDGLINRVDPNWLETNKKWIPILKNYTDVGNKFSKFQNAMTANSLVDFFNVASCFKSEKQIKELTENYYKRFELSNTNTIDQSRIISFLGMIDIVTYLEGDIMTKVDRATMQLSLEGREPFLDHNLIEYSQRIPDKYKIKGNESKYLLRKILYKNVPRELIERPKQGFSIPLKDWLLSYLKDDLYAMIDDCNFYDKLGLNKQHINTILLNFLEQKKYSNPNFIWFIYSLYKWYQVWIAE